MDARIIVSLGTSDSKGITLEQQVAMFRGCATAIVELPKEVKGMVRFIKVCPSQKPTVGLYIELTATLVCLEMNRKFKFSTELVGPKLETIPSLIEEITYRTKLVVQSAIRQEIISGNKTEQILTDALNKWLDLLAKPPK